MGLHQAFCNGYVAAVCPKLHTVHFCASCCTLSTSTPVDLRCYVLAGLNCCFLPPSLPPSSLAPSLFPPSPPPTPKRHRRPCAKCSGAGSARNHARAVFAMPAVDLPSPVWHAQGLQKGTAKGRGARGLHGAQLARCGVHQACSGYHQPSAACTGCAEGPVWAAMGKASHVWSAQRCAPDVGAGARRG